MAGARIILDDGNRVLDSNGDPISGALVRAVEPGTSTPAALYTTKALATPHSNPVVADASGFVAQMWGLEDTLYDIRIYAAADTGFATPLREFLNVRGVNTEDNGIVNVGLFTGQSGGTTTVGQSGKIVLTDGYSSIGRGIARYSTKNPFTGSAAASGDVSSYPTVAFAALDGAGAAAYYMIAEFTPTADQLGFGPGTLDATAVSRMNTLLSEYAGKGTVIFEDGADYATAEPLIMADDGHVVLRGTIRSTNTGADGGSPPIYFGCFALPFISNSSIVATGWTAGTPETLYFGDFNSAGDFELDSGEPEDSWFAALSVGDKVLFISEDGYQYSISGGAGGTGIKPECIEPYIITGLTAGSPNTISFDRPAPPDYTAGALADASNASLVDDAGAGTSYNILFGATLEGWGAQEVATGGLTWYRHGSRDLVVRLQESTGYYGFGGNLMVNGDVHIQHVHATQKAWDIAAQSHNSVYRFKTLVCDGTSSSPATGGAFGENPRDCHIIGEFVSFPANVSDSVIKFNDARGCSVEIDRLDAPVATSSLIQVGNASTVTATASGSYRCMRNRVLVRELYATAPARFVYIVAGDGAAGTLTQDNVIDDGCRFYGTPSTAAVTDDGTRTYIGGYYENGDIDISGATDATVNVRLDNGIVYGQTEATAKEVHVNGARQWPGAHYPAEDGTVGATSYTPDASTGQVGATHFEHRIGMGSTVTALTINAPTNGVQGQLLTIEIRNDTGGNLTPTLNAVFVGVTPGAITNTNKSKLTFQYSGADWVYLYGLENVNYEGAIVLSENFAAQGRWSLETGLAITGGKLEQTGAAGTARLAELLINRLKNGSSYKLTTTMSARTAGAVTPRLGGTAGAAINTNATTSQTIVAGSTGVVSFGYTSAANLGLQLDDIIVQEL